jgi:beta-lactamase regulating signal transducer with metallopeptidase domain
MNAWPASSFVSWFNDAGASATAVAVSMSVQLAILVGVLSGLDWLIRHRARAALRHGLWMLVVIKLLLPVDLLSPTAIAYWAAPWLVTPAVRVPRVAAGSATVVSEVSHVVGPVGLKTATPANPKLQLAGGLLLVWVVGCGAWAIWVLVRSREVARQVRDSDEAPEALQKVLAETAAGLGLRSNLPRLCLTDTAQGPALCGLFRPVILLPRGLSEQIEAESLRQVLRHELIHLQRWDLAWNLLQVCVQIAWWWNPLVWFANARIRSLREAAVDEAVMLEPGADDYPATLVAVARYCAVPPRMPMAFLGVLESGSRLEARVRRLLDRPLPRSAKLGWVGCVTVLVAGAVFLPMGFARRVETPAPPTPVAKAPTDPNAIPAGGSTASSKPLSAATPASNTAAPPEPSAPNGPRADVPRTVPPIDTTPQVLIEGLFIEIRASLPPEWVGVLSSNRSSVRLTAAMARDLTKVLGGLGGTDILNLPRMTTLSTRGAEVSLLNVRTVIDSKVPLSLVSSATDLDLTSVRKVSVGPTLRVSADVSKDTSNPAIEISAEASIVEFLGYALASNGASEPLIRTNLASAGERIWDGQSVLMDAGAVTNRVHFVDKVVHLGDLPLVGRFFRKEGTQDQVSRLFVLVTPTLIDAAGRPIHDPAHPPFDPATFPPKP